MMKKWNMNSPINTSRRFFYFLVTLLLTSSMSYAACDPKEAYANNSEEEQLPSGKMYISEGATLFIAEGAKLSGAEIIHSDITDTEKAKVSPSKQNVEKPVVKKASTPSQPTASAPPIERFSSNAPIDTWNTNAPYNKQVSITTNISFKYVATVMDTNFINLILFFIAILVSVYQRQAAKTLLFGRNFQRPPPMIS